MPRSESERPTGEPDAKRTCDDPRERVAAYCRERGTSLTQLAERFGEAKEHIDFDALRRAIGVADVEPAQAGNRCRWCPRFGLYFCESCRNIVCLNHYKRLSYKMEYDSPVGKQYSFHPRHSCIVCAQDEKLVFVRWIIAVAVSLVILCAWFQDYLNRSSLAGWEPGTGMRITEYAHNSLQGMLFYGIVGLAALYMATEFLVQRWCFPYIRTPAAAKAWRWAIPVLFVLVVQIFAFVFATIASIS